METEFAIWLQESGASLDWLFRGWSDFGPSLGLNVLLAGLYWCWDYGAMSRVWLANLACSWLAGVLKLAFHMPRPYWVEPEVRGLAKSDGFGMPSGHALTAAAVWGELARQWQLLCRLGSANRRWLWVLCGGIFLGVGVSRVYLGVHSMAQVVTGIGLGLAFLRFSSWLEARMKARFLALAPGRQLLALFFCSVSICAAAAGMRWWVADFELPAEWVSMALEKRPEDGPIRPFRLHSSFLLAGMGFGFFGGYRILVVLKRDRNARDWRERALRFLLGGALLAPYGFTGWHWWRGEGMADWPLAAALLADYLHGLVTGALVSLAAPLLFYRLKL